jgi:HEPN domain-containing protein
MPRDPERTAETRAWFVKAGEDLRATEAVLGLEEPLCGVAVFHAQQAAEKAMKGFLAWHDVPLRKTHNLVVLGEQCAGIDASLEPLLRSAAGMTEYAWQYRYPGEPDEPEVEEAREAIATARAVVRAILALLPSDLAAGLPPF